jgi:uncharacterized protein (TIGR02300 family)
MTKPELGVKRLCISCGTKFFDLNKDPIVCPKCMAVFAQPQPGPVPPPRAPGRQPLRASKEMVPKVSNEEGESGDEEVKSTTADAEEVNGEDLLLDDQDEAVDTAEIIDADIEKDDT